MRWPWVWRREAEELNSVLHATTQALRATQDELAEAKGRLSALVEERERLRMEMATGYVPQRVFDFVVEERARLREEVDSLLDHIKRIDRVEHGLRELPKAARPELRPMPDELVVYIDGFGSRKVRQHMKHEAYRRHGRGESWEEIKADILPNPPVPDQPAAPQPQEAPS